MKKLYSWMSTPGGIVLTLLATGIIAAIIYFLMETLVH